MAVARPSFFKPLMKNFSTILWLPPGFVRKHRHLLPEMTKLRIRSGKSWTVKIEKADDDEDCFFTEGWSDFVKDLGLHRIQMLVFWLNVDDGTFDVSVYDPDSNERHFSAGGSSSVIMIESDSEEDESEESMVESDSEEDESDETSPPRFRFALTKNRCSRMALPKGFATEAGLIGKSCVILQYLGRKRYWKAALWQRCSVELGVGWHDFIDGNKLEFGRIYSFEFNFLNNLILVSDCSFKSEATNLHATVKNCEGSSTDRVWRFVKELKSHHFTHLRLVMPKTFSRGMWIATGDTINLEDSWGTKKWPVAIKDRGDGVLVMFLGFNDFLHENNMQIGDILLLESVPNSVDNVVIKFVVMEKEAGKEMIVRSGSDGIIMT